MSLSQDFSRGNAYKIPETWQNWPAKHQEILASLFIQKGESELQTGNGKVFESFPLNPTIFYRQGII